MTLTGIALVVAAGVLGMLSGAGAMFAIILVAAFALIAYALPAPAA